MRQASLFSNEHMRVAASNSFNSRLLTASSKVISPSSLSSLGASAATSTLGAATLTAARGAAVRTGLLTGELGAELSSSKRLVREIGEGVGAGVDSPTPLAMFRLGVKTTDLGGAGIGAGADTGGREEAAVAAFLLSALAWSEKQGSKVSGTFKLSLSVQMILTEGGLVNSELDSSDSSTSSEIVLQLDGRSKYFDFDPGKRVGLTHHSSLQSTLPSIEVHASKLSHRRT